MKMERNPSPMDSNQESLTASSPPSSPTQEDVPEINEATKKKGYRKKRKTTPPPDEDGQDQEAIRKHKKPKQKRKQVGFRRCDVVWNFC
jgi:hypothetical protein